MLGTMSRWLRYLLVPVTLAAALGCPQETAVWVTSGSVAPPLVFRLGPKRGSQSNVSLGMLTVFRCLGDDPSRIGDTVWKVRSSDTAQPILEVSYGALPIGFVAAVEATPLTPGCYVVQISGTGRTRFRIARNGIVTDEGDPW